jgi:hypothetical protein
MYAHVNKRTTTKKLKLMCEKKNEEGLWFVDEIMDSSFKLSSYSTSCST